MSIDVHVFAAICSCSRARHTTTLFFHLLLLSVWQEHTKNNVGDKSAHIETNPLHTPKLTKYIQICTERDRVCIEYDGEREREAQRGMCEHFGCDNTEYPMLRSSQHYTHAHTTTTSTEEHIKCHTRIESLFYSQMSAALNSLFFLWSGINKLMTENFRTE